MASGQEESPGVLGLGLFRELRERSRQVALQQLEGFLPQDQNLTQYAFEEEAQVQDLQPGESIESTAAKKETHRQSEKLRIQKEIDSTRYVYSQSYRKSLR